MHLEFLSQLSTYLVILDAGGRFGFPGCRGLNPPIWISWMWTQQCCSVLKIVIYMTYVSWLGKIYSWFLVRNGCYQLESCSPLQCRERKGVEAEFCSYPLTPRGKLFCKDNILVQWVEGNPVSKHRRPIKSTPSPVISPSSPNVLLCAAQSPT